MRNIYVNGCSFSKGHKELIGRDGKPWPAYFQEDNVINDSMDGGSSFRSLRMCMQRIFEDMPIDIMICQLTSPERGEVFLQKDEFVRWHEPMYIAYMPHRFIHKEHQLEVLKREGFNRRQENFKYLNEKGESIEDKYYHKFKIFNDTMLTNSKDRELHIIGLCNNLKLLCEAKGIKLLFTAMSERCIPNVKHITPYFTKPMSHIVGEQGPFIESETDFHPNEAGHEKIYRYILSELEKL